MLDSHNPLADEGQPQLLSLSLVKLDPEIQPRQKLNQEVITEYSEAMRRGGQFPPIIAYFDDTEYWLADGFHRIQAWKTTGKSKVLVEVRPGSRREAMLFAVGANLNYGFQRTNADRHRAVERLLNDEKWSRWSNREIARRCGVHHQLVGNLRKKLCSFNTSSYQFRKGGDGRVINITNIGKHSKNSKPSNEKNTRIVAYSKNT